MLRHATRREKRASFGRAQSSSTRVFSVFSVLVARRFGPSRWSAAAPPLPGCIGSDTPTHLPTLVAAITHQATCHAPQTQVCRVR